MVYCAVIVSCVCVIVNMLFFLFYVRAGWLYCPRFMRTNLMLAEPIISIVCIILWFSVLFDSSEIDDYFFYYH